MFTYVSFRALLALMISLILSLWLSKKFITYMKRKRHIEKARDEEIDPYGVKKKGVPSMGGVVIIFAILVPVLLLGKLSNVYIILLLVTLLWFGLLGFYDDWKKLKGNKDGLKPRYKLMAQFTLGALVGVVLYMSPQAVLHENVTKDTSGAKVVYKTEKPVKSTITTVPFFKNNNLDYLNAFSWISDGKTKRACGWILFIIITTFVITAVSNGANLNDGMDGMCAGNSAIIGTALGILAYVSGHIQFASYLNVMFIPGSEEIVPGQGVHGRHRISCHRWCHRRHSGHHPQGAAPANPLRNLPRGEPLGHHAGHVCQTRQQAGKETQGVQAHAYPRPFQGHQERTHSRCQVPHQKARYGAP